MEFHQVRYFLAACDHLNLTQAARVCSVSQPALTRAIQKLETELGGALFLREGRRFQLTPLGRTMRTHLGQLEESRRLALSENCGITSASPVLDVGIMSSVGPVRLGRVLSAFHSAAPRSEIILHDVCRMRAREMLLAGALDCAILARHDPLPERFEGRALTREPMALAMAPDHPLATGTLTLSRLAGARYIDRVHCEFRRAFFDALLARGLKVDIRFRSTREDWVQIALAAGQGVAIVPRDMAAHRGLRLRTVEDMPAERVVELVTVQKRSSSRTLRRFLRFLETFDWSGRHALDRSA